MKQFSRLAALVIIASSAWAQQQVHGGQTIIGGPLTMIAPNDGSTGTTVNQLAKINSSGNAIAAGTGDTAVPVYIVSGGAGTSGNAQLAIAGQATCQFDGTGATIGHFVVNSTATAKRCMDAGATEPTAPCLGQVMTTAAANATATVALTSCSLGGGGTSLSADGVTILNTSGVLSANNAVELTRANAVSNNDKTIVSASASGTAYTGCPTAYTIPSATLQQGSLIDWVPDVNGSGGSTTLTVCSLSAINVKEWGGTSNPSGSDIVAHGHYQLYYDGTYLWLPYASSGSATTFSSATYYSFGGGVWPQSIASLITAGLFGSKVVHCFSLPIRDNVTLNHTIYWTKVSATGKVAVGLMDVSGNLLFSTNTAGTGQPQTDTISGGQAITPGVYNACMATDDTTNFQPASLWTTTSPGDWQIFNTGGAVLSYTCANNATGSGGTLALPSTCGTRTVVNTAATPWLAFTP